MSDFPIVPASGGDLAPYSPSQPLVPVDTQWSVPQPDFMAEHQSPPTGASSWFGHPVDSNAATQLNHFADQITGVFSSDMAQLGMPSHVVDVAIAWFKETAFGSAPNERPNHSYSLADIRIPAADKPYVTSFLNQMSRAGASEQFIQASLWWFTELGKRLQAGIQKQAPNVSRMSEAEAARQIKSGTAELQMRWGGEFRQRLGLVMGYLSQFPEAERIAMENRVLPNGHLAGSDADFIEYLYIQSTGGDLPAGGAALAAEIASLEKYMRTDSRSWFKNEQAQARLRLLYEQRDG